MRTAEIRRDTFETKINMSIDLDGTGINNISTGIGFFDHMLKRYGFFILPMDEALILCSLDISGRPYLNFDAVFPTEKCGDMDMEMVEEFFKAVCLNSGIDMHIKMLEGKNSHHIAEGIFKCFAKALDMAVSYDERIEGVLSTKGMLEV